MQGSVGSSCAGAASAVPWSAASERLVLEAEVMGYEVLDAASNSGGRLGHWATHLIAMAGATDSTTEGRSRGLVPLPMPASPEHQ